jgi:osmoprotectant transport system ATP-binding protein
MAAPEERARAITFAGVTFRRGTRAVVDNLTLDVHTGDIVALVGRSGAGKSTVLRLANGLLMPDAGAVRVEGRDTREWNGIQLRRRIGYVLQEVGLFPHMTVAANIAIVPQLEGWPRARQEARTRTLLDLVGLPASYAERWPHELSGGERQRVGVARALAVDPPMLLMDEPFGALDPITRAELRREFAGIQQRLGITVILVTHDMAEAFSLGHRVGVLDAGRLIVDDAPGRVAASSDPRVRQLLDTLVALPEPAG